MITQHEGIEQMDAEPVGRSLPWECGPLRSMHAQVPVRLLILLFSFTCARYSHAGRPPNLVVIIADDLGYGETGMQGNIEIPTPAIDALAASGVRCTAGYVTASYCSPSRAGLMTGRYQSRFGYDHNPTGQRNFWPAAGLPESESTFISLLRDAGYQTALVGKWHLGATAAKHPLQHGFDRFYGFLHEGRFYVPGPPYENVLTMLRSTRLAPGQWHREGNVIYGNYARMNEPDYDRDNPIFDGQEETIEPQYLTDAITQQAVNVINDSAQRPFALIVAYNAVHSPMQGLFSDLEKVAAIDDDQRRIFAAMLLALDRGVGEIVAAIQRQRLTEETLVVFLSDHGGPTAELTSSNAPLRGGKGELYEGGVRVPMIWSLPGRFPSGQVETRAVLTLDIAATALALAGLPVPANMDGVDATAFLSGEKTGVLHEHVFWRMPNGKAALRKGDWKWITPQQGEAAELYHLVDDPTESRNLAQSHPDIMRELTDAWHALNAQMAPPLELIP